MNHLAHSLTSKLILAIGLFAACSERLAAQGIPEPSLVLFGTIRNTAENNIRLIEGRMIWQFRNTQTQLKVAVAGSMTNILDQFSYVLQVPCETLVSGFQVSSNSLQLTPSATLFDRSQISITVGDIEYPASFVIPSQSATSIASTDRGRMEQVDLTVRISIIDADGNGLPDDWETAFFGFAGVDPASDEDGDGLSNLAEYLAGTNPRDAESNIKFIRYFPHSVGGFQVEWSSVEERFYVLDRSSTLLPESWTLVRANIAATPPINTFHDTNGVPPGPQFYRLRLEP